MRDISYEAFLQRKKLIDPPTGLNFCEELSPFLKPIQRDITRWALKRGRAAIWKGTGLGKTLDELEWSKHVSEFTDTPVLLFAPNMVVSQIIREAERFGYSVNHATKTTDLRSGINISNYQKLHLFNSDKISGLALDESSILKAETGHYRNELVDFSSQLAFRLAATATPSPNDYMEIGNHAEFLGVMSYTDMLATFFTHDGSETQKWRIKGHAENEFWKWVASWAVMLRKPSDLGYSDDGYELPPLHQIQHTCAVEYKPDFETGMLFPIEAHGLGERIKARRASIEDRVDLAISLVNNDKRWLIWCNLNSEQDMIEQRLGAKCLSVRGSNSEQQNNQNILDWLDGKKPYMAAKTSMLGYGLNFHCCHQMIFVGLNDSFEQIFQAVRRCWRFGQEHEVYAHFVASEIEGPVVANLRRKERDDERMVYMMIRNMSDFCADNISGSTRDRSNYNPTQPIVIPEWLGEMA